MMLPCSSECSARSIQVLIPSAEHAGWKHATSPFLSTYLECYRETYSPFLPVSPTTGVA